MLCCCRAHLLTSPQQGEVRGLSQLLHGHGGSETPHCPPVVRLPPDAIHCEGLPPAGKQLWIGATAARCPCSGGTPAEPRPSSLGTVGWCGTSLPHVPALSTPLARDRVPWAPSEPQLRGGGRECRDTAAVRAGSDGGCSKASRRTCSSTALWEGFPPPHRSHEGVRVSQGAF